MSTFIYDAFSSRKVYHCLSYKMYTDDWWVLPTVVTGYHNQGGDRWTDGLVVHEYLPSSKIRYQNLCNGIMIFCLPFLIPLLHRRLPSLGLTSCKVSVYTLSLVPAARLHSYSTRNSLYTCINSQVFYVKFILQLPTVICTQSHCKLNQKRHSLM